MGQTTKRFVCSYAGQSEYEIDGTHYEVRHWAICSHNFPYAAGVLDKFILPTVGTVRYESSAKFHSFPPADVVAMFPGFVGARWSEDFTLEYDGKAPKLAPHANVPEYMTFEGSEYAPAKSEASSADLCEGAAAFEFGMV